MKFPASRNKPVITIALHDDQRDAFVPLYTTLDKIQGEVTIIALDDMSFDTIQVSLEGSSKTFVEKIATASPTSYRTEAFQVFLRLLQPLDMDVFPAPRIMKAQQAYRFPFTFVVPQKLLPQSCRHEHASEGLQNFHLNLPPSLGDPMTASLNGTLLNDMAPEMSVISYAIKVRIASGQGTTGKPMIVAEISKKLRIVPAVDEHPPLVMHGGVKDDYLPKKEKDIKKGLFKGKLGTLTMESAQPRSLRLPALKSNSSCPITTMATVNLRFDPCEEGAKPPRLNHLCTKLKATTFYSSMPMNELPVKTLDFHYGSTRGVFVETVLLSSRCVASAQWERHSHAFDAPDSVVHRDSAFSSHSSATIPEPSSPHATKAFYTAQILVPITLPESCKVFVPTFHSCLVSRVYSLDLCLEIQGPSSIGTAPSIHLKLPIQISSEGNADASLAVSPREADAMAAREFAGAFDPRSSTFPSPEYSETSPLSNFAIPSPEYTEFDQLGRARIPNLDSGAPDYSAERSASPAGSTLPPSYPDRD